MESRESETAAPVGGELRAPEPVFSELIDRWLLEGERLDAQARPPSDAPPPPPETWQKRAVALAGEILAKHRLEVLVAIGLVPLTLFLIVERGGHRQPSAAATPAPPAPRAQARAAVVTAAPPRSAPVALVSMPESPHVRLVPKPAPQPHKRVVHAATHAPPPFKPAPSKTALTKLAPPRRAPANPPAPKAAPTKVALSRPAAPQPGAPRKPGPAAPAPPKRR